MSDIFPSEGAYRTLWRWERQAYLEHLKRLSPNCRRARFHRAMSDDALALHVKRAFSSHVHITGWFLDGVLRGATEVAVYKTSKGLEAEAAFAVEAAHRNKGVGHGLLHRAALFARNRGANLLHIDTERDNQAMLRLAIGSGAAFDIRSSEAEGVLESPPRSVFSLLLETAEEDLGALHWAWDRAVAWATAPLRRGGRIASAAGSVGPRG